MWPVGLEFDMCWCRFVCKSNSWDIMFWYLAWSAWGCGFCFVVYDEKEKINSIFSVYFALLQYVVSTCHINIEVSINIKVGNKQEVVSLSCSLTIDSPTAPPIGHSHSPSFERCFIRAEGVISVLSNLNSFSYCWMYGFYLFYCPFYYLTRPDTSVMTYSLLCL